MDVGTKLKGPDGVCFSLQWRRGPSGDKNLCNKREVAYYQNQFTWQDPVGRTNGKEESVAGMKLSNCPPTFMQAKVSCKIFVRRFWGAMFC